MTTTSASETSQSTGSCVSPDDLKQYLSGWCDEAYAERIESHLAACPVCERALREFEIKPDTLLQSLESTTVEESQLKGSAALDFGELELLNGRSISPKSTTDDPIDAALTKARQLMDVPSETAKSTWQPASKELGVYELLRPLGRGGMGAVYLATHRQLHKHVAIKLLPVMSAEDSDVRARFQREIRVVGKLNHPSIVAATDAGEIDGTQFLVMEYVPGMDLSRLARLLGKLMVSDACELMRQVALGLSCAHAEGVVHRDVKPSNLMLDEAGRIRILDFGLAQLSFWDEASIELTTVGQLMGTLDYMAPEQAELCGGVDYRADLYAMGATLFRLLCGRPPLAAAPNQSPLEKLRLLANHQPPKLDTLCPEAPPELVKLMSSLLARSPQDRPASAAHVAEELAAFTESSDLVTLLKRAEEKEAESPNVIGSDRNRRDFMPAMARSADAKLQDGERGRTGGLTPPRSPSAIGRWIMAAMLPLLVVAGILIKLETDKGQLVIESDVADVKVRIINDGKPVSELTIKHGTTATRLRADKYEVVIDGPSDGLTIENDQFTLKNGTTVVARIRQDAATIEPALAERDQSAMSVPAGAMVSDPLAVMRAKLDELELELQLQSSKYGAGHARMKALQQEIDIRREYLSKKMKEDDARILANEEERSAKSSLLSRVLLYEGKSLDEWLEMLSRKRSPAGLKSALEACQSLVSEENAARVTATLLHVLPRLNGDMRIALGDSIDSVDGMAGGILRTANPGAEFYKMWVTAIDQATDDAWKKRLQGFAIRAQPKSSSDLEPLVVWAETRLHEPVAANQTTTAESSDAMMAAVLLRGFVGYSQFTNDQPFTERVAGILKSSNHLDQSWWLSQPLIYRGESDERRLWPAVISNEIVQRAIEALDLADTSPSLVAQACMILANGAELNPEQQAVVVAAVARRLSDASTSPEKLTLMVQTADEFSAISLPEISQDCPLYFLNIQIQVARSYVRDIPVTETSTTLQLLNLARKLDQGESFKPQLDQVLVATTNTLKFINPQRLKYSQPTPNRGRGGFGGRQAGGFGVELSWPALKSSAPQGPLGFGSGGTNATAVIWGNHEPTATDWHQYLILLHPVMKDTVVAALER